MAATEDDSLGNEIIEVKEEVDCLEDSHYDDVGRIRLENIQAGCIGQNPLERTIPLDSH